MQVEDRLIVAADVHRVDDAYVLLDQLRGTVKWVKVGLSLFALGGPSLVQQLVADGWKVFVDLKLHDIPHQVGLAVANLCEIGASILTVHTGGGLPMMEAAAKAATTGTQVVGVTVLTSLTHTDLIDIGYPAGVTTTKDVVLARAEAAKKAGLAGVICSPLDASGMVGFGFDEVITPGIRLAQDDQHDQKRVQSPDQAIRNGATRLVVGRSITQAANPAKAAERVLSAIDRASRDA